MSLKPTMLNIAACIIMC